DASEVGQVQPARVGCQQGLVEPEELPNVAVRYAAKDGGEHSPLNSIEELSACHLGSTLAQPGINFSSLRLQQNHDRGSHNWDRWCGAENKIAFADQPAFRIHVESLPRVDREKLSAPVA